MAGHIFISYAREDQDFVLRLARDLKERGVPIWLDLWHIPPGTNWDEAVDQAIASCAQSLVVLSSAAVQSSEAKSEWLAALADNKPIVPILRQKCPIPRQLLALHYLDFTSYESGNKVALSQLVQALKPHPTEDGMRRKAHIEKKGALKAQDKMTEALHSMIRGAGSTLSTFLPPPGDMLERPIPKEDTDPKAALAHSWERVGEQVRAAYEKLCEEEKSVE